MRHLKILSFAALSAAVLLALAGNASATTLTSPAGTTYTGTVEIESEGTISLHGSFLTVESEEVELKGSVSEHGAARTVRIPLSFLKWIGKNYLIRILKRGTLEWHGLGNGNGTITWSGLEMEVETSVGNCIFTTSNTDIGTFTSGTIPRFHFGSAAIPRTGGSFFCGSSGTLTGTLKLRVPHLLYTD